MTSEVAPHNCTPAFEAAWLGDASRLRAICASFPGAATAVVPAAGVGPLSVAAAFGDVPALQALLTDHEVPSVDVGGRALVLACGGAGAQEAVELLLHSGADWAHTEPGTETTALHAACASDSPHAVHALLSVGASPGAKDARGRTPLLVAAEAGAYGPCESLTEALAAHGSRHDEADEALSRDAQGRTAIFVAACMGHALVVDLLLEVDELAAEIDALCPLPASWPQASCSSRVEATATALGVCALRGDVMIVRELLDAGADPAVRSPAIPRPRASTSSRRVHVKDEQQGQSSCNAYDAAACGVQDQALVVLQHAVRRRKRGDAADPVAPQEDANKLLASARQMRQDRRKKDILLPLLHVDPAAAAAAEKRRLQAIYVRGEGGTPPDAAEFASFPRTQDGLQRALQQWASRAEEAAVRAQTRAQEARAQAQAEAESRVRGSGMQDKEEEEEEGLTVSFPVLPDEKRGGAGREVPRPEKARPGDVIEGKILGRKDVLLPSDAPGERENADAEDQEEGKGDAIGRGGGGRPNGDDSLADPVVPVSNDPGQGQGQGPGRRVQLQPMPRRPEEKAPTAPSRPSPSRVNPDSRDTRDTGVRKGGLWPHLMGPEAAGKEAGKGKERKADPEVNDAPASRRQTEVKTTTGRRGTDKFKEEEEQRRRRRRRPPPGRLRRSMTGLGHRTEERTAEWTRREAEILTWRSHIAGGRARLEQAARMSEAFERGDTECRVLPPPPAPPPPHADFMASAASLPPPPPPPPPLPTTPARVDEGQSHRSHPRLRPRSAAVLRRRLAHFERAEQLLASQRLRMKEGKLGSWVAGKWISGTAASNRARRAAQGK